MSATAQETLNHYVTPWKRKQRWIMSRDGGDRCSLADGMCDVLVKCSSRVCIGLGVIVVLWRFLGGRGQRVLPGRHALVDRVQALRLGECRDLVVRWETLQRCNIPQITPVNFLTKKLLWNLFSLFWLVRSRTSCC